MGCSTSTLDDDKTRKLKEGSNMEASRLKITKMYMDTDSDTSPDEGHHHECGFCQSPIDISNNCNFGVTKVMKDKDLLSNPLRFSYPKEVKNCTIMNKGSTVQINIPKESKCTLSVHGKTYNLVQFHFHTPSEHLIDGHQHEMEMHLVHLSKKGEIAVLGYLFKTHPNKVEEEEDAEEEANDFLSQFWSQLPAEKTEKDIPLERALSFHTLFGSAAKKFSENVRLNQTEIDMEIYEYLGSLTTPPYTEGVQWLVSKKIHYMTRKELGELSACWNNKNNARPVQEYCGRTVLVRQKSNMSIA